jgi:hypothetical protein
MKILKENDVRINLMLNYGELYCGYVGQDLKIDEVLTGPIISESDKILEHCNKYYTVPSVFVHNNFQLGLHQKLHHLIFPCDIVKVTPINYNLTSSTKDSSGSCDSSYYKFKIDPIYKIHRTSKKHAHILDYNEEDEDLFLKKDDIITERKIKLESLKEFNGIIQDYVLGYKVVQDLTKFNFPKSIYSNVKIFFECFRSNKLHECIVTLRRIRKEEEFKDFQDENCKKYMRHLECIVKKKIIDSVGYLEDDLDFSSFKEINFTFTFEI